MAFIPVPNCVEVALRFIWAGQNVTLTLSFCKEGGFAESDMDDLNAAVQDWWVSELSPLLGADLVLQGVNITDLSSESAPSLFYPCAGGCPGDNAIDTVPNNVALVTTFVTAQRGRSFRGRNYMPGLPANYLVSSVEFNSSIQAAQTAAYAALATAADTLGWTHVVISRRQGGVDLTEGVSTPITAYRTEVFADSQRRRLAGRGA